MYHLFCIWSYWRIHISMCGHKDMISTNRCSFSYLFPSLMEANRDMRQYFQTENRTLYKCAADNQRKTINIS